MVAEREPVALPALHRERGTSSPSTRRSGRSRRTTRLGSRSSTQTAATWVQRRAMRSRSGPQMECRSPTTPAACGWSRTPTERVSPRPIDELVHRSWAGGGLSGWGPTLNSRRTQGPPPSEPTRKTSMGLTRTSRCATRADPMGDCGRRVGSHETGLRLRPGLGFRCGGLARRVHLEPRRATTTPSVEPSVAPVSSPTPSGTESSAFPIEAFADISEDPVSKKEAAEFRRSWTTWPPSTEPGCRPP